MSDDKLYETVTIKREITGPIRDLVLFVKQLREQGRIGTIPDDEVLVQQAKDFWEAQHGDEHG